MNLESEKAVYEALKSVYSDGAFSTIVLNRVLKSAPLDNKAYITNLFYGVLEKSIQLDYIISQTAKEKPQNAVAVVLKIGLYLLRHSTTPDFAAVNKTVELARLVGKIGVEGFVNAVLRKSKEIKLPSTNTLHGLSVNASYPEWIIKKLTDDFDLDFAKAFVLYDKVIQTHIRPNTKNISKEKFEEKYPRMPKRATEFGYYVSHGLQKELQKTDYIIQSLGSMRAIDYLVKGKQPKKILDLCAAPGGKSVLLKQLFPEAEIVACDIHSHRIELIKKYADNVGVELTVKHNDARVLNEEFVDAFDIVLCDVPCSGIGVANKKPEIILRKSDDDVNNLSELQFKILSMASNYVKKGGRLGYSTCTVFKTENDKVVEKFLKTHKSYAKDGDYLKLFPHIDHCDGFFASNMIRTK